MMMKPSTRQRYIAKGFITPCPFRNRPKLTVTEMLRRGFWSAAKAKQRREAEEESEQCLSPSS